MKKLNDVLPSLQKVFDEIDISNFDLNTSFKENEEWDSLTALSLITVLDEDFGVSISGEKIKKLNTIKDLLDYINE